MPIFQIPEDCRSTPQPDYLKFFYHIQADINSKIQNLDDLSHAYKDRMERHFLITFSKLMNKISQDLILAEEAYKNIDKELATDSKCVILAEQINFFRNECEYYKTELQKAKKQIINLKQQNLFLFKQKQALSENILKKVKQSLHFKTKCKQYQQQYNISTSKDTKRYRSLAEKKQQTNNAQCNQKGKLMLQIQQQIKKRKKINFTALTYRNNPEFSQIQESNQQRKRSQNHSSISKRLKQINAQSFCEESSKQISKSKPNNRFDLRKIADDLDFNNMKINPLKKQQNIRRQGVVTNQRMRSHRKTFKDENENDILMSTIY